MATLLFLLSVKALAEIMIPTASFAARYLVERPLPWVASPPIALHSHQVRGYLIGNRVGDGA
jgi:hypothetical protein